MDLVEMAAATALILRRRKKRKGEQRLWVHPLMHQRVLTGRFQNFFTDLRLNREKFFNYFRMSVESFDKLLSAVGPRIKYQNTVLRSAVPPEERLATTLRYLATGASFQTLHLEYFIGKSTIAMIIRDTCMAIWDCLQPVYMPGVKDTETWLKIAEGFYERTSFPNCIGAIDGKCIPTKKTKSRGSETTVLMAVTDADYSFIAVEIVTQYYSNDKLFKTSEFGRMLESGEMNLPNPRCLPNDEKGYPMPFVVAGGEAFPGSDNIVRPYSRKATLDSVRRIFNYRLSRANSMADCCFAMLMEKWHILHSPLGVSVELCSSILKTLCVLHNFLRKNEGVQFEDTLYKCSLQGIKSTSTRGGFAGIKIRDYFTQYFISPRGSVPWQDKCLPASHG